MALGQARHARRRDDVTAIKTTTTFQLLKSPSISCTSTPRVETWPRSSPSVDPISRRLSYGGGGAQSDRECRGERDPDARSATFNRAERGAAARAVSEMEREAVWDEDDAHAVANAWRPTFRAIVSAFVRGDYGLAGGVDHVEPVSPDVAKQIRNYIADYGETLIELSDDTWDSLTDISSISSRMVWQHPLLEAGHRSTLRTSANEAVERLTPTQRVGPDWAVHLVSWRLGPVRKMRGSLDRGMNGERIRPAGVIRDIQWPAVFFHHSQSEPASHS